MSVVPERGASPLARVAGLGSEAACSEGGLTLGFRLGPSPAGWPSRVTATAPGHQRPKFPDGLRFAFSFWGIFGAPA